MDKTTPFADTRVIVKMQHDGVQCPIVGGKQVYSEWAAAAAAASSTRKIDDADDDSEDGSSSESDDGRRPSVDMVLGKDAFGSKARSSISATTAAPRQSSHFRRLRTTIPMKRKRSEEKQSFDDDDDEDDQTDSETFTHEKKKRRKRRAAGPKTSEPQVVRDADAKMIEPHPAVMFMREHTPIRPCGRCRECRKRPCGECANCKNNAHLSDRSHDRKRCTALGCTRMSDCEIEKYRTLHDSADSTAKIESDLRTLRDRFMKISSSQGTNPEEIADLTRTQDMLMKRLQAVGKATAAELQGRAYSDEVPEGYGCLLLSFQTLETERDRIARLIDRRTTRDSPEIMRTRRQLRNFYALTICNIVRMFANDVVAAPHVERLKQIADEYETLVRSLPVCI
jgi:hypothetical protein